MFFCSCFRLVVVPCKQSRLAVVLSSDRVVAAPSTLVDVEDRMVRGSLDVLSAV
jgi:hypothetical protein